MHAQPGVAAACLRQALPYEPQSLCFLICRHILAQLMVGVAYFGHALLVELLLPKLKASAPARVVWMSGALESQANIRWDDLG